MSFWVIFFIVIGGVNAVLDDDLIRAYFDYKHVSYGSVYGCFSKKEQVKLGKQLMVSNLSISIYNIADPDFDINDTYVFTKNNDRLGIALDADCQFAKNFLDQCSLCEVFTDTHHWLVFLTNSSIEEMFSDAMLTVGTDLKVALPNYEGEKILSWNLYDVYNQAAAHHGQLKVRFYHAHNKYARIVRWKPYQSLYWLRRNMTGVRFRTMVVLPKKIHQSLDEYLVNDEKREDNSFNRFHAVLIYHIRDFYNFSMNMSMSDSWGYKLPNGSFDGLVRALEYKLVDFGSSPLFVKNERWPVVDYGRRSWLLRSAFIFRIPKRPASFEVFLRPLDGTVWYVTVVAIIVIVVLFKIAFKIEFKSVQNFVINNFEQSWSFLTLFTIGALCQQGASDSPDSICSRILFLFVFIMALLLYQFYSASIVSILLMTPAKIIKNLRDLASSNLFLGCEDVLYNKDYIKKLGGDPIISMLETKAPIEGNVSFYSVPEVGLPLVAAGGYAYHVEVATAYPIIEKTFDEDTICSLDEIQLFQTQQMHQVLQKHSPFREMLNHVLQKIDEFGIMKRQLKHWHARKPECIRTRPPTSAVSIEEFYPALSFLLFGMIFSIGILIIENLIKFRYDKLEEIRQKNMIKNRVRPFN